MAMAPQNQTKRGDIRVYFISCMLFVCIIAGGTFLAMYIALPESESDSWYPTAGMILVGIPWIFWLLTLLYTWIKRTFGIRLAFNCNNNKPQQQEHQTTPPANGESVISSVTESPVGGGEDGGGGGGDGEAGHVRFGPDIVLGSGDDQHKNLIDGSLSPSVDEDRELGDDRHSGSLHTGAIVSSSSIDGSSIPSHESELPLFSKSS